MRKWIRQLRTGGDGGVRHRTFLAVLVIMDALCALAALAVVEMLQREINPGWVMPELAQRAATLAGVAVGVSLLFRSGRSWTGVSESSMARVMAAGFAIGFVWICVEFLVTRGEGLPRQFPLKLTVLVPCLMVLCHWASATLIRVLHLTERVDDHGGSVLVAGRPDEARALIDYVLSLPAASRTRVVGVVCDRGSPLRTISMKPQLGSFAAMDAILERLAAERRLPSSILMASEARDLDPEGIASLRRAAERYNIAVFDAAENLRRALDIVRMANSGSAVNTSEAASPVTYSASYMFARRLLDVGVAVLSLALLAVPMLIVAALVKLDLGSPVLFRQERLGRYGRPITVLKFRTMHFASAANGRPLPDGDRKTAMGDMFRRLRLDELPQLWNILKGDISLVGPRPLIREHLERLPDRGYLRSFVRPGLTGWAQLHGGQTLSDDDKFILDAWYVIRATIWLDLKILFLTPLHLFTLERVRDDVVAYCQEDIREELRQWTEQSQAARTGRRSSLRDVEARIRVGSTAEA